MVTPNFPEEEKYGLTSQLRKTVVSFPSNIDEIDTQIMAAKELGFIDSLKSKSLDHYVVRSGAILGGQIASLKSKNNISQTTNYKPRFTIHEYFSILIRTPGIIPIFVKGYISLKFKFFLKFIKKIT